VDNTRENAGTAILTSYASSPGNISLSTSKLRALHPELFSASTKTELRDGWIKLFASQLEHGDARAAVVIDPEQGIVAAYTDELDCVAMLQFKPELVETLGWKMGARLLTVNGYSSGNGVAASDLTPGPEQTGRWNNFRPLIAELLTDDPMSVEQRKREIPEEEWSRALRMGKASRSVPPRDGRPLRCDTPARTGNAASPSKAGKAATRKPQHSVPFRFSDFMTVLALMIASFGATWVGVSHLAKLDHDMNFYLACFGVVFFGALGVRFGFRLYGMLAGK